jgi:hypothetical protein
MNCILNFIDVGPHAHKKITIIVFIYFMESVSLFLFVLWSVYRFLYLFDRDLILVCIEILSLFVFVLSRVYRLYLFFTCDVGEIDNEFRVNTILLPVIFLCAWEQTHDLMISDIVNSFQFKDVNFIGRYIW